MKLFIKTTVYLMLNTGSDEDSYDPQPDWNIACELNADVQPYSGGLAQKEYGLAIECQKRMYTECNDLLIEGVGVTTNSESVEPEYIVIYAERWDDYIMAILKRR